MLRRSHKKSRGGCLECKRRHVKCDEGRPACVLCTMSGRDCSFTYTSIASDNLSSPAVSSRDQSISPADSHTYSHSGVAELDVTLPLPVPLYATESPKDTSLNAHRNVDLDETINFSHMKLIIHLITHREAVFNLADAWPDGTHIGLRTSLEAPYFMYAMLAFSARHLAFQHPESVDFYHHQAVTLQTRAVSLFNAAWTEVTESNCVPLLLFSTVLGHHILADTLSKRDPKVDMFLTHYLQCVEMHRGVYTIFDSARPLLMESEIEGVLAQSERFTSRVPRGSHCQQLMELVESTDGLNDKERDACIFAAKKLQVGFDAILTEEVEPHTNRYQMISSWSVIVPSEFTALLSSKRPEALIVLAYYALMLHYGNMLWQVGDAGEYILGLIVDHLGPEWDHWLEYPRERMANS